MRTDILVICTVLVAFPVFSAEQTAGKAPATGAESMPVYDRKLFDPSIPRLSKEQINRFFARIKEGLLDLEVPSSVKQAKKEFSPENANGSRKILNPRALSPVLYSLKRLTLNWELEEVSRTKMVYFNMVGRSLSTLMEPLGRLESAVTHQREDSYKKAVEDLEKALDALDKVIKEQKKHQLTAAEYAALRKKNMARRKTEIEALMKKLGVDKYGRPIRKKQGHR